MISGIAITLVAILCALGLGIYFAVKQCCRILDWVLDFVSNEGLSD